ncbi:hypothetical protein DFJ74DRAFT_773682 [Hyaloraphidium curvatum]|nr:hypothetical protein DFJ74DRAFT_773682 [Hyaloraphidium curvatum]
MAERIRRLPGKEADALRSAPAVSSVADALVELMRNSIDAGASSVTVSLDADSLALDVVDDGAGIPPEDLPLAGLRAHSSKPAGGATFGHRGEALASIAAVARLELESARPPGPPHLLVRAPNQPAQCQPAASTLAKGTRASVRDFFRGLPVRRKRMEPAAEAEAVRRAVEGVALAVPGMAVVLIDVGGRKRVLDLKAAESPLRRFAQIYGAQLAGAMTPFDETVRGVRVQGALSLAGTYSRALQLIYINRRPLDACELHEAVNEVHAPAIDAPPSPEGRTVKARKAARRDERAEKHGYYLIHVTLPAAATDGAAEWEAALPSVRTAVAAHLVRCGAIAPPPLPRRPRSPPPPPPAAAPAPRSAPAAISAARGPFSLEDEVRPVRPGDVPARRADPEPGELLSTGAATYAAVWDPVARRTLHVDVRTGNTYATLPGRQLDPEPQADRTSLRRRPSSAPRAAPWAADRLSKWQNPVYPAPQAPIPSASAAPPDAGRAAAVPRLEAFLGPPTAAPISREELRGMRAIGQLDRKFVVCAVRAPEGTRLVAVDQHAADERVRVERFLRGMFGEDGRVLRKEARAGVQLGRREAAVLRAHAGEFRRWGFAFEVGESEGEVVRATATALPAVVSDRLASDPGLLRSLVREHLQRLEDPARKPAPVPPGRPEGPALWRAVAAAPRGLVDAVNSRACRSAIMFGDVLDARRVGQLLAALAECDMPFQCAHGRPSMVPLATVGNSEATPCGATDGARGAKVS